MQLRILNIPDGKERPLIARAVRIQLTRFASMIDRIGVSFSAGDDQRYGDGCRLYVHLRNGLRLDAKDSGSDRSDAASRAALRIRDRLQRRHELRGL